MKKTEEGPTPDGEIKTVMAGFCMTARSVGTSAAERAATVHLVAAAAYLEKAVGPARTRKILSETISSIGYETSLKH